MTIKFETKDVVALLLSDGVWHAIEGGTLYTEPYPFSSQLPLNTYTYGFRADAADGSILCGPLTGILAMQTGTPHDTDTENRSHSTKRAGATA